MLSQVLLRPCPRCYLGTVSTAFYGAVEDVASIYLDYRRRNFRKLSTHTATYILLIFPSRTSFAGLRRKNGRGFLFTHGVCVISWTTIPTPPSEGALRLLNMRFSGRCMLPGLRDVRWISAPPEHLELMLPLIISPVLTNFRLGINNIHPLNALQVIPVLESLAPAYNSLVEVRVFQSVVQNPRVINAASTLLLKCNPDKLRYFHVDSVLSVEAFIHGTQLPNLERFFIRTNTTTPDIPLPTSTFPSLRSLEIKTTGVHSPLLQTLTNI